MPNMIRAMDLRAMANDLMKLIRHKLRIYIPSSMCKIYHHELYCDVEDYSYIKAKALTSESQVKDYFYIQVGWPT